MQNTYKKIITIAIPFFNEENTIREIFAKIKNLQMPFEKEIILVDDGSSDKSYERIKNAKGAVILRHKVNMGKGAAVKTALANSKGDIFIVQDADLELNPDDILKVIKPIADGKADVVYGSRNVDGRNVEHSLIFYWGGKLVTEAANLLYGTNLTDEACGYKAFRTSVLKSIRIKENRFEWEPEVTAKISRKGIKIKEVPVSYNPRTKKQGKKLGWKDGIKALWALIRYRF